MALRFFRSIPIAPGVRLNLSATGVSVSLGKRGTWLTIGKHGATASAGLPGTGARVSKRIFSWGRKPNP
jgi:hypothetical protein